MEISRELEVDLSQFIYDEEHHIHRLDGFFIDGAQYTFTVKKEVYTGQKKELYTKDNINVTIEGFESKIEHAIEREIKFYYLFDLFKLKTFKANEIYKLKLHKLNLTYSNSNRFQKGG